MAGAPLRRLPDLHWRNLRHHRPIVLPPAFLIGPPPPNLPLCANKERGLRMRGCRLLLLSGILLLLLSQTKVVAGSALAVLTFLHNCQTVGVDPDTRIEACTQLIHGNLVSHGILTAFYTIRANAYFEKGDLDHALEDYNKALELKPDFPEALVNRGKVLLKKGDCAVAIQDFDHAIALRPADQQAWQDRGVCKTRLGDASGAASDLAQAKALGAKAETQSSDGQ